MRPEIRKAIWSNAAWTTLLAGVVLTLIGGSIVRLQGARAEVAALSDSVQIQKRELELLPDVNEQQARLTQAKEMTLLWTELVGSEASRISELSAAARAAGVTIVSFDSSQPETRDDGHLLVSSFELVGVGSFDEISRFLSGVYSARGMAAIERMTLVPDPGGTPDKLRATLTVVWTAPGPGPEPIPGEEAVGA